MTNKVAILVGVVGILFTLVGIGLVEGAFLKDTPLSLDEFTFAWVVAPITLLALACAAEAGHGGSNVEKTALGAAVLSAISAFYFFFMFVADARWRSKNPSQFDNLMLSGHIFLFVGQALCLGSSIALLARH